MKIEFTSPISLSIQGQDKVVSGYTRFNDGMHAVWLEDNTESIVVYIENNKFIIDHVSGRADDIVGEAFLQMIIDNAPSQQVRLKKI